MTGEGSFHERVAARVDRVIAEGRDLHAGRYPVLADVFDRLSTLVSNRGKGTRADAVHLGWQVAGGEVDADTAVNVAAAFELLHLAALVHDDLIDGSPTRRGAPTVHVDAARRHRAGRMAGDTERYANGIAVLTGNVLSAIAQEALGEVNGTARHEWTQVQLEVNLGQYLDLVTSAERSLDFDRADAVMHLKTASYTFARPLRAGAAATGSADEWMLDGLGTFGYMVGMAFQVRDDILGVFGDPAVTGKPAGGDLREGKATVLLVRSSNQPGNRESGVYARVGSPDLTDDEIAVMRDTMERDGTREWAEDVARGYVHKALDQLGGWADGMRGSLENLARSAVDRSH